MISFKGSHLRKDVILYAVYFYVRYAAPYRDMEEIMAERGVDEAQRQKSNLSWRMDETYI